MNNEEQKKIIKKERRKGIFFSLLCSVIAFILGISLAGKFGVGSNNVDEDLDNFIYYYNILKNEWYFGDEELNDKALSAAIKAIYQSNKEIDPYTYFTEAPVIVGGGNEEETPKPVPTYGIGIQTRITNVNGVLNEHGLVVSEVYKKGGSNGVLEIGDQIIGCYQDDEYISFIGLVYDDVAAYIKTEKANSPLKLRIIRNNIELDVEVIRKSYSSNYVFENKVNETTCSTCVGIRVTQFTNSTSIEFEDVMDSIIAREKLEGNKSTDLDLILDLRDNPGGYVTAFTNIADYFLPSGLDLIYYEHKDGHLSLGGSTTSGVKYKFNSITILVNENSASASEALALALIDYSEYLNNKVQVVGTKSFGKGIAQNEVPLPDGSSIRYTFARTLSPDKYSIHGVGITPDVEIPYPDYIDALTYVRSWLSQFDSACVEASKLGGSLNE